MTSSVIGPVIFDPEAHSYAHKFSVNQDDRFVYSTTLDLAGDIVSRALDTHDHLVRKALIEMGWTPPSKTGSPNGS